MSKLSLEQVEHLVKLAHLEISAEQKEQFALELSDILGYVEQINRLKTGAVAVGSTITGLSNVLRGDEESVSTCLPVKEALKNAPNTHENYFKVKAIFDND